MQTTAYVAASVDGFIARPDGGVDWLGEPGPDTTADYDRLLDSVDGLVMGRKTYEKVLTFGEWPYPKPVVVLSKAGPAVPPDLHGRVEMMSGSPEEVSARMAAQGWKHAYIDGGQTIQRFLEAGRLSHLVVTWVPVLLGKGIPLFGESEGDTRLRLLETRSFEGGLVQNRYEVL